MLKLISLIVRGTRELGLRALWDTFTYLIRKRFYRARFGGRGRKGGASPHGAFVHPGAVRSYERRGRRVTVLCAEGFYVITVLSPNLLRVRLLPTAPPANLLANSYSVVRSDGDWPPSDFDVEEEEEEALEIKTAALICRIAKDSGRLAFFDLEGNLINEDENGAGWRAGGGAICQKRIQSDERFYGLGERTFGLERRGRRYGMWNTDPRTYRLGQDPIHMCIPVLLGLHSRGRQGYGIFFDNTFRGWFDLGAEQADVASFAAEGGELCYYFIYGPELTAVVERYTELTGRMRLPPRWMLGYHQSRWSYHPEARVRRLAADFRQVYQVPCDCIHLDIHYMDGYRVFTWNAERFPDPAKKIADLHEMGFKVILIVDPGVRADHDYWVCRQGLEEDVFCTYPDGEAVFQGPVWPGDCYFPDFTAARVRAWWGELFRVLTDVGVDGIWNDMNEPAIFGVHSTTMPDFVSHDLEGRGGEHTEAHNIYGMQMARATTEGLLKLRPEERPVCITRSGWAGVQRYAMSWTGDNRSKWSHLSQSMPMLMNLGLSGMAHTGPDIGGYSRFATGELFTRWVQMGVFLPFFRAHTFVHSPDQEPWSWGEPYLSVNRRYIELRYQLLPYLYTVFWECARSGLPIVRPLFLDFQDDPLTHTLEDQFMCGDAFLVAPVVEEGATGRSVYLPVGDWYDFWNGERFSGPARFQVAAPLDRLPLFVRAGSVVPMGPVMQYVDERPLERLTLHVYPGEGTGRLYKDDGRSHAYRSGEYRLTRFALSSERQTAGKAGLSWLDLRRRVEGDYEPACRGFEVVIHGVSRLPRAAAADGQSVRERCDLRPEASTLRVPVGLFEHLRLEW